VLSNPSSAAAAHLANQLLCRANPLQQLSSLQLLGLTSAPLRAAPQHVVLPHHPEIPSIITVPPVPVQALNAVQALQSVPFTIEQPLQNSSTNVAGHGASSTAESQQMFKKHLKRAANRRSAQMSRKRKKAFVDDLKAENSMLKRNKDILDCIPDLVFVFDALCGRIIFASNSVNQCLQVPTARLVDLSIFNLVTESSGKNLKAVLDKICEMQPSEELRFDLPHRIELCFLTKYMTRVWGELDGVIHFKDDKIECICSFRPSTRNLGMMTAYGSQETNTPLAEDSQDNGSEDARNSGLTSVADESSSTSSYYPNNNGDGTSVEDSDENLQGISDSKAKTAALNSTETNILSHQKFRKSILNKTCRHDSEEDSEENT